jgi:hypothetical protein
MSLWGNLDAANNAPKSSAMAGYGGETPQVTANSQVYYANTQLGAFTDNQAVGIFGVSAAEQANSTTGGNLTLWMENALNNAVKKQNVKTKQ